MVSHSWGEGYRWLAVGLPPQALVATAVLFPVTPNWRPISDMLSDPHVFIFFLPCPG